MGLVLAATQSLPAAQPFDTLLPASTKSVVIVPSVPKFVDKWNRTQIGELAQDADMQAFGEDFLEQLNNQGLELNDRLGITYQDLDGLASGELAIAQVTLTDGKASGALIVNVGDNAPAAQRTIDKMTASLARYRAVRSTQEAAGATLQVYDIPPQDERPAEQVVYFLHRDHLCVTEGVGLAADIAQRLKGKTGGDLASVPAYQMILKRTASPESEIDLKWYVDPFGLSDAVQARRPRKPNAGRDPLKVARTEGFDAIKGTGGIVSLMSGPYDTVSRALVYAPPRHRRAMRMLSFPNGGEFTPEPWVPADVATYSSFQWDMQAGFDNFGTLFDALFGEGEEGVFQDVLESIRTDPNGPQLDLNKDLVAHLGKRATVLTDFQTPITPHSQRRLFAAEATNEAALAMAVERSMKNDKDVRKRQFGKFTIYEILPEDQPQEGAAKTKAAKRREQARLGPNAAGQGPNAAGQGRLLPNAAVCVGNGYLMIATHIDLLVKILSPQGHAHPLADDPDYRLVAEQVSKLGATATSLQGFVRQADRWYVPYELFKLGKLPEADMPLAQALNQIFADGVPEGQIRKQRFDGRRLPGYDVPRKYLGTGGTYVTTEADGWLVVDFAMKRHAAPIAARSAAQ